MHINVSAALFEDAGRKTRTGSSPEFMTWETPNLASFTVTLYVKGSEVARLGELVELSDSATSPQDEGWHKLQYGIEDATTSDGWTRVVLTGEAPEASKWFKLTLKGNAEPDAVQVGQVELKYRSW